VTLSLIQRPRRVRLSGWSRRLCREHSLSVEDLIWPFFVLEGESRREAIESMPGVERLSLDHTVEEVSKAVALGIPAVAPFPYITPDQRNSAASEAVNPDNLLCRTLRALKQAHPDLGLIADVALDPYTDHGHDGLLKNGDVDNDSTVALLAQQAVVLAQAGASCIAPSDMMDGRVGVIRQALDAAGFSHLPILAYAAKYASTFYSPFREAVGTQARLVGTKQSYQMDPANIEEALREVQLDLEEGADMILIKPGMPYLDVLSRVKQAFQVPTFAYQVSGEYALIEAAAEKGWINRDAAILESLLCFKRAGADGILTYYARHVASLLQKKPL
jgi:porphobilinogen synthase